MVYAISLCIHPSVSQSVSLSLHRSLQVGVLLKQFSVESRKHYCMITHGLCFMMYKILAKFKWGHPQWEYKIEVGKADFNKYLILHTTVVHT